MTKIRYSNRSSCRTQGKGSVSKQHLFCVNNKGRIAREIDLYFTAQGWIVSQYFITDSSSLRHDLTTAQLVEALQIAQDEYGHIDAFVHCFEKLEVIIQSNPQNPVLEDSLEIPQHTFSAIRSYMRECLRAQSADWNTHETCIVVVGDQAIDQDQTNVFENSMSMSKMRYAVIDALKHEIRTSNKHMSIFGIVPKPSQQRHCDFEPRNAVSEMHRQIQKAYEAHGTIVRVEMGKTQNQETKSAPAFNTTRQMRQVAVPQARVEHIEKPGGLSSEPRIKVLVSVDFDAVSGWLGTGGSSANTLSDYSSGYFAARVGVRRILALLKRLDIADKCTWFVPGHSAESFEDEMRDIVASGCEIGYHGYAHESAHNLTDQQQRDVIEKCISIIEKFTGEKPVGFRCPLYSVKESTLDMAEEYGFEYDSGLTEHESQPYYIPRRTPIKPIDFTKPASSWMHPLPKESKPRNLVEIPCNWYTEDMTPLQYWPHTVNSQGYVDVRVVEQMWKDRFIWLWENEENAVFPVLLHPDTSGMAHIIGMIERFLSWVQSWGSSVEFYQHREVARQFRERTTKDLAR